jgi:hypothetical protein
MTTDTEKLAADIKRVMELDAKRTQGSDIPPMIGGISERGIARLDLEDNIPLMADIIRRQQEAIKILREALRDIDGHALRRTSPMRADQLEQALALAAPLVKEKV